VSVQATRLGVAFLVLVAAGALAGAGASAAPKNITFDLAAGSVDGRLLLGRTVASVTAALGKPDDRSVHKRQASLRYGPSGPHAPSAVNVFFRPRAGRLRAVSVSIASPAAKEVRLGAILRLPLRRMQRAIARGYAGKVELEEAYRCRRKPLRCQGTFSRLGTNMRISFGLLYPGVSSERYISMYAY
jgi:hypothetical protein